MRRRLTLLVAATTSIILLAFTLPLALLIDRTATSNAVATAADRSQRIVPVVLSGTDGEIRAAVRAVSDPDYRLQVTLPGGQVLGRTLDVARPAPARWSPSANCSWRSGSCRTAARTRP